MTSLTFGPISGMGGHESESKWGFPEVAVSVRRAGEDAQIGVIQEALVVSARV